MWMHASAVTVLSRMLMHFTTNTLRKWRKPFLALDTAFALSVRAKLASPLARMVESQTGKDALY
jgi:hypothetical protein